MRFFRFTHADSTLTEDTRQVIANSRELLKQHIPDTFAGRKTQEPFPQDGGDRILAWLESKELQPPK